MTHLVPGQWTPRQVQVTGAGVYVRLRHPGRYFDFRTWGDVPPRIRSLALGVCRHVRIDAGRLGPGSRWTVAQVFVPHEVLPFGAREAVDIAENVVFAVEGARA